jgi:hypothetical protein
MMAAMSSADGPFGPGLRRGESEEEAIDGSEIGRPLPAAITDEQLVLEQQGLGGDGADAPGAKELRKGDQQVDGKDEDLSHRANRTMTAGTCQSARRVRIASHYEFATHTPSVPRHPGPVWLAVLEIWRTWRATVAPSIFARASSNDMN